jgi:peptidoglycan/LPS O-acetylase OafA/YrhL
LIVKQRAAAPAARPEPVGAGAGGGAATPDRAGAERLVVLDGCRFVAALLVVSYHYLAYGSPAWAESPSRVFPHAHVVAEYGWLGVELFFLISGFVISMSTWGKGLGGFAVSRVVRLFPAYWFGIVATTTVLLLWPTPGIAHLPLADTAVNLTMLQRGVGVRGVEGVYWSLWLEIVFYALFAVVVWRGLTYQRVLMFCLLWTGAATMAVTSGSAVAKAVLIPDYAPFFISGVAFHLIRRYGSNPVTWVVVGWNFLLGIRPTMEIVASEAQGVGHPLPQWGAFAGLCAIYALMAAVASGVLDGIRWRGLTVAGALTYPLYLLHEYIGWTLLARLHTLSPGVAVAVVVAIMLVAAWLVHRFVERPLAAVWRPALDRALTQIAHSGRAAWDAGDPDE